ncbi:helix-turn-helix transcriptional regulator [Nocardia macrotermitis]|uniref:HTH luxR-type domain-containing protein n=1 Tax=Nocardia macrotermitis TaxID=2585198 RepID=A0A7K0D9U6_9NOCA|nr:LuxR family transcriptional regulator [Nocardia macrotermitis]MQY22468.1 hypothetical protein [Nocardia macrotermitis]
MQNCQSRSEVTDRSPRWSAEQHAALSESLRRARDGQPTVLLIEGGPGSGKTTFLRRVVAEAQGFHLLQLQPDDDRPQPFSVLHEWGVPDTAVDPGPTVAQGAKLLRDRIEQTRSDAPVLLVVDDTELLDTESSDMIARLVERTFSDRLLVVVATHSLTFPTLEPWKRLKLDTDRTIHLELSGLSESAFSDLLTRAWPDADPALCTRLWRYTSGNPLYLQHLLHDFTLDEIRDTDEPPAPAGLIHCFLELLDRLDTTATSLLAAAIVLGDRWTALPTVAALAELEDPAGALESLRLLGVIDSRGTPDRLEIRITNGIIRAVGTTAIQPAQRQALHRRAAALTDAPIDALRHRYLGSDGPDDDLADELAATSWALHLSRDYRQASLTGMWSSRVSSNPVVRERRYLDALFDLILARELDAVDRHLARLDEVHDEARRKLVEAFLLAKRWRGLRSAAVILSIPAPLIDATDPCTRLRLYLLDAWLQVTIIGSVERAQRSLELADELDPMSDPCLTEYYYIASAVVQHHGVRGPRPREGGIDLDGVWIGVVAASTGLPDVAVRQLEPYAAQLDDDLLMMTMRDGEFHAMLGYAYWLRGDWSRARERIDAALAFGSVHPMVRAVAVLADVAAGNPDTMAQHRATARAALWEYPATPAIAMAVTSEFLSLRLTGQPTDRYLETLNKDFGPLIWYHAEPEMWQLTQGMINAAAGRPEEVRKLAASLADAPEHIVWRAGASAWLRGLAAECDGDPQQAARHLNEARAHGMAELRVHRVLLAADLARVRRTLGDEAGAAEAQRESDALLAGIEGAGYLITPTVDPLAQLSDREREVANLLTQGLSYAQIATELCVSRSTVGFHLSNIYAKTETSSRHQLTDLVRNG